VHRPSDRFVRQIFEHQRWLQTGGRYGRRLEIRGTSSHSVYVLRTLDLNGIDFSKAILENVIFNGASLKEARFVEAELRAVQFGRCDVSGANFTGAKLDDVSFRDSNYHEARFDNVDTARVHWEGRRPVSKAHLKPVPNKPKP
jgi:hypothetical protein